MEGFAVPVDAGHILQFTRAIEVGRPDATPVTRLDLIAPPTFLAVVDHFDPDFNRRPTPGQGAPAEQDQPLFHVEHGAGGTEHRPLSTMRWVFLTPGGHEGIEGRLRGMIDRSGLLPEFIEIYIREVLGVGLRPRGGVGR